MLRSVSEIVDALGGTAATAELAGVGSPAVSNWRARGSIPAEYFLIFEGELGRRDLAFDCALFGLKREVA